MVLLCPRDKREEIYTRFTRIGYDNVLGFTSDDLSLFKGHLNKITTITAAEWQEHNATEKVLDVRKEGEWNNGHLQNSVHFALD